MRLEGYVPRVLFVLTATTAVAASFLAAIYAYRALLLLFVGALLGILLDGAAQAIASRLPISRRWAARLLLVVALVAVSLTVAFGAPVLGEQLSTLARDLPQLVTSASEAIARMPGGRLVLESLPPPDQMLQQVDLAQVLTQASTGLFGGLLALVVCLLIGVWVGVTPRRYLRMAVRLLPEPARPRAVEVADATHHALQLWLVGRLVDMTVLATLTGLAVAFLGLPHPVPLGIVAGLFEFVPYVGPFLAVLPIGLTALAVAPDLLAPAIGLYFLIQMLQSYVITPLIEQKAVSVPPAVGISAQVVATYLAGPLGLLVATPVVVLITVLVQSLWIEDGLHEDVHVLGT